MYKKPLLCITFFFLRVILSVLLYYVAARARKLRKGCPQGEKKYTVYESCLRERFKVCVKCLAPCKPSLSLSGSCQAVVTECHKDPRTLVKSAIHGTKASWKYWSLYWHTVLWMKPCPSTQDDMPDEPLGHLGMHFPWIPRCLPRPYSANSWGTSCLLQS